MNTPVREGETIEGPVPCGIDPIHSAQVLNTVSEGWPRVPGFPLTAGRPLYSELMNITLHASHVRYLEHLECGH